MSQTDDQADADQHAEEATPQADAPAEDEQIEYEASGRIGWRKGLVIFVAVVLVYTIVETRRRVGWEIPWSHDLDACLAQAQHPRKAVILLVHKRDCKIMKEIETDVFGIEPIYDWAMKGLPCRLVWEDHPDVVKKYQMTESPTLLMLNPEGDAVFGWSGYGITNQIWKRFPKYAVGQQDEGTYRKSTDDAK